MSQPILISGLLKYFINVGSLESAVFYGILLSIGAVASCITHHIYYQVLTRTGMQMRVACSGLIYKRVIRFYFIANLKKIDSILN